AVGDVGDVAGQRQERVPLAGLAGEGEGAHGAAVEGAVGGDDVAASGHAADLEGGLVGLGAGVAEVDLAVAAEELQQPFGEGDGRLGDVEVGDVAEGGDLRGDGLDDGGVGVAERVDGDAADEVGVGGAVGVPHGGALAADQGQARRAVVVHQRALPARRQFLVAHDSPWVTGVSGVSSGTTMVPMPSSVKISSRIECWTRPSMTRAVVTPLRTACRQPSIFGTMPEESSGRSFSSWDAVRRLIT